jgi:hypothetical protein
VIKKLFSLFCGLIYFLILRNAYSSLHDVFGHIGFDYLPNEIRFFINLIALFILFTIALFSSLNDIIRTTATFIILLFTVPAFIYFEFNQEMHYIYIIGHFFLPLFFILIAQIFPNLKLRRIKSNYSDSILIIVMLCLIIPVISLYGFNLNFSLFQLNDEIYDVRFDSIEKANRLTSYIGPLLSSVICPIVLLRSISRKNTIGIFLALLVMLILFQSLAHKTLVLSVGILIFFYVINDLNKFFIYFSFLISLILALLFFDTELHLFIVTFIVYRFLFIPVQIGGFYFDFFESKSTYWTQSVFNPFSNYSFDLKPANLIGEIYFNNPLIGANTGLIADGFMNAGICGIIINITLFSIFFLIFLNLKMQPKYFGIVFLHLISFQNSPLNTVMVTHGFLLTIFLFFLIDFS